MAAFAERYGFVFRAHEMGDANRSARVERPFSLHREQLPPRAGASADWARPQRPGPGLVRQGQRDRTSATCGPCRASSSPSRSPASSRCPVWVPEVYLLHQRIVDVEGYVSLHTNRYSVPAAWLGRSWRCARPRTASRSTTGRHGVVATDRVDGATGQRVTAKEHRPPEASGAEEDGPSPEEKAISQVEPRISWTTSPRSRSAGRKQTTLALRQLLRMMRDYPQGPLREPSRRGRSDTASSTSTGSSAWSFGESPTTTSA